MADQIDHAIAAANRPAPVDMVTVPVQIASTGRLVMIMAPADLTDAEVIELGSFILLGLRAYIAANAGRSTGIVDALGAPIRA